MCKPVHNHCHLNHPHILLCHSLKILRCPPELFLPLCNTRLHSFDDLGCFPLSSHTLPCYVVSLCLSPATLYNLSSVYGSEDVIHLSASSSSFVHYCKIDTICPSAFLFKDHSLPPTRPPHNHHKSIHQNVH